ncbi:hypothetical protein KI387_027768, partial [Taxus chinensis]
MLKLDMLESFEALKRRISSPGIDRTLATELDCSAYVPLNPLLVALAVLIQQKHKSKLYFNCKAFAVMSGTMEKRGRAAVVVLGDLGRSPRMQYHALSLARQASFEVDIVAYAGTEPHGAVLEHPSIHLHLMRQPIPQGLPRFLYLLVLPLKTMLQFAILIWYICFKIPTPDLFLVQNPPSVPTLVAVRWACWMRKSAFLIDWHNFGYNSAGLDSWEITSSCEAIPL